VRAARWLETFACKEFVPPPSDQKFNEYVRDPSTEGMCQQCHGYMMIDPAAVHFKRWQYAGVSYGQIGESAFPGIFGINGLRLADFKALNGRPKAAWAPGLTISPATQEQLMANPNAAFLDFQVPDARLKLFGLDSDGTIGPLGFAKMLVRSGEFDRCAVRKMYQRFVGRDLDPGVETGFIDMLAKKFVEQERKLRPFLQYLMHLPEFRRGT